MYSDAAVCCGGIGEVVFTSQVKLPTSCCFVMSTSHVYSRQFVVDRYVLLERKTNGRNSRLCDT